jgi:hypothetical protein
MVNQIKNQWRRQKMSGPPKVICEYCKTRNPWESQTCLACGGPLTHPKPKSTPNVTTVDIEEPSNLEPEAVIQETTEKADEIYFTVWNTYAIAWRTLGEAIAIALCSFILGLLGGATGIVFPGILGGVLVGLAVGLTRKQFYIVLISAPAGLLLGLGFGAAIWFLGGGPQVMVYTGLVFAIIGAIIGGKSSIPFGRRNCWEKARPLLGAVGGFVFGVFGTLLGWGVASGVQLLLQNISP